MNSLFNYIFQLKNCLSRYCCIPLIFLLLFVFSVQAWAAEGFVINGGAALANRRVATLTFTPPSGAHLIPVQVSDFENIASGNYDAAILFNACVMQGYIDENGRFLYFDDNWTYFTLEIYEQYAEGRRGDKDWSLIRKVFDVLHKLYAKTVPPVGYILFANTGTKDAAADYATFEAYASDRAKRDEIFKNRKPYSNPATLVLPSYQGKITISGWFLFSGKPANQITVDDVMASPFYKQTIYLDRDGAGPVRDFVVTPNPNTGAFTLSWKAPLEAGASGIKNYAIWNTDNQFAIPLASLPASLRADQVFQTNFFSNPLSVNLYLKDPLDRAIKQAISRDSGVDDEQKVIDNDIFIEILKKQYALLADGIVGTSYANLNLPDGHHNLSILTRDNLGNLSASYTNDVVIDRVKPKATLDYYPYWRSDNDKAEMNLESIKLTLSSTCGASGLKAGEIDYAEAPINNDGTLGGYGAWQVYNNDVRPDDKFNFYPKNYLNFKKSKISKGNHAYKFRFNVTNKAGIVSDWSSPGDLNADYIIKVDTFAPTVRFDFPRETNNPNIIGHAWDLGMISKSEIIKNIGQSNFDNESSIRNLFVDDKAEDLTFKGDLEAADIQKQIEIGNIDPASGAYLKGLVGSPKDILGGSGVLDVYVAITTKDTIHPAWDQYCLSWDVNSKTFQERKTDNIVWNKTSVAAPGAQGQFWGLNTKGLKWDPSVKYTVLAYAVDRAGNQSNTYTQELIYNNKPLAFNLVTLVNNDQQKYVAGRVTKNPQVELKVNLLDRQDALKVAQMEITGDITNPLLRGNKFVADTTLTLKPGDGQKEIMVMIKDTIGNVSYGHTVVYFWQTPPEAPKSIGVTPSGWIGNNSWVINWYNPLPELGIYYKNAYWRLDGQGPFNGPVALEYVRYIYIDKAKYDGVVGLDKAIIKTAAGQPVKVSVISSGNEWQNVALSGSDDQAVAKVIDDIDQLLASNGIDSSARIINEPSNASSFQELTLKPKSLSFGQHTLEIYLEDSALNSDPAKVATVQINYDNKPPTNPTNCDVFVLVQNQPTVKLVDGTTYKYPTLSYFQLTGAADDGAGIDGYYTYFGDNINGDPTVAGPETHYFRSASEYYFSSFKTVIAGEKPYYLIVQAKDKAGNPAASPVKVFTYKFGEAPAAPVNLAVNPAGWVSGSNIKWNVSWTNPQDVSGIAAAWARIDNDTFRRYELVAGQPSFAISPVLATGIHNLEVYLEDGVGNADPANVSTAKIYFDKTDPLNPTKPCLGYQDKATRNVELVNNNSDGYPFTTPYFDWSTAPGTDTVNGIQGSGLAGYYVYFGTVSSTDPTRFQTADKTYYDLNEAINNRWNDPLIDGQTYYLIVKTQDNVGNVSSAVRLFTYTYKAAVVIIAPQTPGGFKLSVAADGKRSLAWGAVVLPANGVAETYKVYRGAVANFNTMSRLYTINAPSTAVVDDSAMVGATNLYFYVVSAKNTAGESRPSGLVGCYRYDLVPGINWVSVPFADLGLPDAAALWNSLGLQAGDLIEAPDPGQATYGQSYQVKQGGGIAGSSFAVTVGRSYRVTTAAGRSWYTGGDWSSDAGLFNLVQGTNWIYLPLSLQNIKKSSDLWSSLGLQAGDLIEKPDIGLATYTNFYGGLNRWGVVIGTDFDVYPGQAYRVTLANPKTWP